MIIVYVADENYTQYLQQSIISYKKFNPKAHIVVVSETSMPYGDENVVIPLYKSFRNRGNGDRITNTAYLKLFLTQLPYDKVLYVDADTICQAPLNELWDIPCEYINLCESYSFGKLQAEAIGAEKYGLTGMMLMNLKELRKINFTKKCLEVENTAPTPKTGWQHDETCINLAMREKLTFIDHKWNYCHNRTYDNPMKESDAPILHFVGKDKHDMLELNFYKDNQEILDAIKGKDVAIVGNAQSIFKTKYGEEIDKKNFVIRFNKGFPNKPESQGTKTTMVILACELSKPDIEFYKAKYLVNRSKSYLNDVPYSISNKDRRVMSEKIGFQPSSGFMAVDLCLTAGAKSINLYGFDWEQTPTYYNRQGYVTQHCYRIEKEIINRYEKAGLLTINKGEENGK